MNIRLFAVFFCAISATACAVRPVGAFQADQVPPTPDYSDPAAWAALPFRLDSADVVPDTSLKDKQDSAKVDVFFIYPTTYIGKRGERSWNADIRDKELNIRTDRSAIRNQATVFNGSCKVYAPRYRQAHLESFFTKRHKEDAQHALALAYRDVYAAFEYYLEHYNKGRPLIIAAHSQGTLHAAQLIHDFYGEGSKPAPELIAAYLVGMPVEKNSFDDLPPCKAAEDIHCYCSWRTVNEKYKPNKFYPVGDKYSVINPLTWSAASYIASRTLNAGAVLRHFYDGLYPGLFDAWIDNGLLRVTTPKIPGVPFLLTRNYHIADYNFFYANLRQNVEDRIAAYFATEGDNPKR